MMIDIDLLLALGATYKKVAKTEIIFKEGAVCNFYYQLVSGQVRWANINNDGKEFIQTIIEPGECFGELSLFDNEPYAATAIADKETVLIRLHKPVFSDLMSQNQDLNFKFSSLLAQRVRFKFMIFRALVNNDPESRISELLGYLKKKIKISAITPINLILPGNR